MAPWFHYYLNISFSLEPFQSLLHVLRQTPTQLSPPFHTNWETLGAAPYRKMGVYCLENIRSIVLLLLSKEMPPCLPTEGKPEVPVTETRLELCLQCVSH